MCTTQPMLLKQGPFFTVVHTIQYNKKLHYLTVKNNNYHLVMV